VTATRLAFAVLMTVATGCSRLIGTPDRHVTLAPSRAELEGVWGINMPAGEVGKPNGLDMLPGRATVLALSQDGGCDLSGTNPDAGAAPRCRWTLGAATVSVHHVERLVPAVVLTLQDEKGQNEVRELYIYRDKAGLLLWSYDGDPDYRRYIEYRPASAPSQVGRRTSR
jgi:hypothetical protein